MTADRFLVSGAECAVIVAHVLATVLAMVIVAEVYVWIDHYWGYPAWERKMHRIKRWLAKSDYTTIHKKHLAGWQEQARRHAELPSPPPDPVSPSDSVGTK